MLSLAREKFKEKNKERQAKKRLETDAMEDEVQQRLIEYKTSSLYIIMDSLEEIKRK